MKLPYVVVSALTVCAVLALGASCTPKAVGDGTADGPAPPVGPPAPRTSDPGDGAARTFTAGGRTIVRDEVTVLQVTLVQTRDVDIGNALARVLSFDGESRRRVPVALAVSTYDVRYTVRTEAGVQEHSGLMECAELRSTDSTFAFTWCVCDLTAMGEFRLLEGAEGEPYLAWASHRRTGFADVTRPRQRDAAMAELLSTKGYRTGAVLIDRAIVRKPVFQGLNTAHPEFRFKSIQKGEEGRWTVTCTGVDPEVTYTLTYDGTEWKMQ